MKRVFMHILNGNDEPKNIGCSFAQIPQVGEFVTGFLGDKDEVYKVVGVIHIAFESESDFDQTNPSLFCAEIWLKNAGTSFEATKTFSA